MNVRIRNTACSAVTPTVSFSADRTAVTTGESVNIAWNVSGLDGSGQVIFSEPDGTTRLIPAAGTDTRIFNSPGTYVFKVKGANVCPDGSERSDEKAIVITVSDSCVTPVISSFTVNPSTVYIGGNQSIVFKWSVSGQIDAQSIDQGIGAVSGYSYAATQPQSSTTYTYSAVGCGQTTQASVTVNSVIPPSNEFTEISRFESMSYYDASGYTLTIRL